MHWPIAVNFNDIRSKGKCEKDIDSFYYRQANYSYGPPGVMYRRIGWKYNVDEPDISPFPNQITWWKWGN